MREERCIGSHSHHIGVALDAGHESGLGQCSLEVVALTCAMGGIFTGEHLRALARVLVVAAGVLQEPFGRHVVMLVHQVGLQTAHLLPSVVEALAAGRRTRGAHHLDVGIFGTYGFEERFEALGIHLIPLLVADTDVFQSEGGGVSHLGTQTAPLCAGITIGELNQVEGIVDVWLQVGQLYACRLVAGCVLELAGYAAAEDGQGRGSDTLGQEEILIEAQT